MSDLPIDLVKKFQMEQSSYAGIDGGKINYCRRLINPELSGTIPVLLFLHGAGERGDDNCKQLFHGAAEIISWCKRNRKKVLLLFPQCPEGQQWVNTPWNALKHSIPEESEYMKLAMEMLTSEVSKSKADPSRIYIVGISMGGFGVWDAISRDPFRFAAAFPVCGGGDIAQAGKLTDIPILTFHGEIDSVVPTSRTRDMVAAICRENGKRITYTEVPGCDHNSWSYAFGKDESWQWLFSQSK
ncbi:MAG: phospholipase [Lentisphaerae bacterium]|nr:phospholipase [Lentisphaerota bacterium]